MSGSYPGGGDPDKPDEDPEDYPDAGPDKDPVDVGDRDTDDDTEYDEYDSDYAAAYADDYGDYGDYPDDDLADRRWLWVAGGAAAVLVFAVIGTVVILRSDNGAATKTAIAPRPTGPVSSAPVSTGGSTTPPAPVLPSETAATMTPSSSPSTTPPDTDTPVPTADAHTVVYTVSGTRQPGDFVSVTYTDGQGALRTDFNVSLPWSKTFAVDPNVMVNSVTATSLLSQLNCTITDASGDTLVAQSYNTIVATCNR
jgi:hypothetical protein